MKGVPGGNDEWKALGTKNRPPGPPIRLSLKPEDVLARREPASLGPGTRRPHVGKSDASNQ